MSDFLKIWTIFDHPTDHPLHFVVRGFDSSLQGPVPDKECQLYGSLDEARAPLIARGLHCLGRWDGDDSKIVESWV